MMMGRWRGGRNSKRLPISTTSQSYPSPISLLTDLSRESFVQRVTETRLPTKWGEFRCVAYRSNVDPAEHIALVMGKIYPEEPAVVRVHSECLTGDIFGSQRCDCGEQLDAAMSQIAG